MSESIRVPTAAGDVPALRFVPAAGSGPGIVLFQEIFGVSEYIRQRAAELAQLGYVVVVPEFYWRLDDAVIDESRDDVLDRAMSVAGRLDWAAAVTDGVAAVQALRDDPQVAGGVGLVGFCFGGGLAFNVAAQCEVDALVSYYGSALPDLLGLAPRMTAPSLHHFGLADSYLPPPVVERIRSAIDGDGVRFETYDGAGHAFDNPRPEFHHASASETAWRTTVDFLRTVLPASGGTPSTSASR